MAYEPADPTGDRATMSDFVPHPIELVGWSGDSGQLALRLGVSEARLLAALRRVGRKEGRRLVVDATPANVAPPCGDGWPMARCMSSGRILAFAYYVKLAL
jgi:hypothetical protein